MKTSTKTFVQIHPGNASDVGVTVAFTKLDAALNAFVESLQSVNGPHVAITWGQLVSVNLPQGSVVLVRTLEYTVHA